MCAQMSSPGDKQPPKEWWLENACRIAAFPVHLYEHRELGPDEKPKNLVLEFDSRPAQDMLVACLWDRWTHPRESDLYSFAAITDEPTPEVAATGHQRTIITSEEASLEDWLLPSSVSRERLQNILSPKEPPFYIHQIAA